LARQEYQDLAAVIKKMSDPSKGLLQQLDEMRKQADKWAELRDEAKPKEVRDRELRNKYREVQGKLDRNQYKLRQQIQEVEDLRSKLAKAEAYCQQLEDTVEAQARKVKELHSELGATSDSDYGDDEDGSDTMSVGPADRKAEWGTVGKKGKITLLPADARLAQLMEMRPGSEANTVLAKEGRWGPGSKATSDGPQSDSDDPKERRKRKDGRSRSPPAKGGA
jgi:TolA-binding protein